MRMRSVPGLVLLFGYSLGWSSGCSGPPPPPVHVTWDRAPLPTEALASAGAGRGLRVVRGIIHLHSPYSHDACDNNPQPGGKPNEPCGAHLRQGLCQSRQDFAMLTDHATHMALTPWERLFLTAPGDETFAGPGAPGGVVGGRLRCGAEDGMAGRGVVLTVGGENDLMPVGLDRHVGDTALERQANMSADDAAAVRRFRDAGALVLQAHGESRELDRLRMLADAGLAGMEVYNLHANVDPRIRSTYLGLDGLGAAAGLFRWLGARAVAEGGPEPDLAALGFLEENKSQLGKYDALLGEGRRLSAMMGSDIHENTFKDLLSDGERGDSYRRLMRWFGNHLLVPKDGELTPAVLKDALGRGRGYGVFEVFGPPVGFDYYAEAGAGGGPAEMGDEVKAPGTIVLRAPTLGLPQGLDPAERPQLRLRVLHVAPGAATSTVVAEGAAPLDPRSPAELRVASPRPGAYRAEIKIVPHHLIPLLGDDAERYRREYPYLYTNPIYVRP